MNMPIISTADLQAIYVKEHISTEIIVSPVPTPDTNTATKQKVEFILKEETETINKDRIKRTYLMDQKLRGKKDTQGKVASHDLLVLKDGFQGGRGRLIHNSEFDYYKEKNLFSEIHVDAAWGGIIAWKRIGLRYQNSNMEQDLKMFFLIPYLKKYKSFDDERINTELENFSFSTIDTELMYHEMEFEDIISAYPLYRAQITAHYTTFHPAATGLVNFGLTDYIRFQAMSIKAYSNKYAKIPMYRKIS